LHGTALFLDLEALSPAHLRTVIARRDRFDKGMGEVLKEGIRSGTLFYARAKLLSFAILGAVNWIPRWFNPDGPSTSEEIAEKFADYLIAGLRRGVFHPSLHPRAPPATPPPRGGGPSSSRSGTLRAFF